MRTISDAIRDDETEMRGDTRGRAIPMGAKVWEATELESGDSEDSADQWVKRRFLLDEIAALSQPSLPARKRLRRMWLRLEGLIGMTTLLEESWAALSLSSRGDATDVGTYTWQKDRLVEFVIPQWQQRFFDVCAETKQVRANYQRASAQIAALWDEFWSLSAGSSRQARDDAFGTDRDASDMWGGYVDETHYNDRTGEWEDRQRYVRDSDCDWEA